MVFVGIHLCVEYFIKMIVLIFKFYKSRNLSENEKLFLYFLSGFSDKRIIFDENVMDKCPIKNMIEIRIIKQKLIEIDLAVNDMIPFHEETITLSHKGRVRSQEIRKEYEKRTLI